MSVFRVWELAKEAFKIQGGTIHQIGREHLGYDDNRYLLDLFMQNGADCEIKLGDKWVDGTFLSYTAIKRDKEGKAWLAADGFVHGVQEGARCTNLRVGYNIRAKRVETISYDAYKKAGYQ